MQESETFLDHPRLRESSLYERFQFSNQLKSVTLRAFIKHLRIYYLIMCAINFGQPPYPVRAGRAPLI